MSSAPPLAERTALVTGAGSGLGRHISLALARAGCRLALVGRSPGKLDAVAAEGTGLGGRVTVSCWSRPAGNGRVRLERAREVVAAAADSGWLIDPNGYLAPASVLSTATEDD